MSEVRVSTAVVRQSNPLAILRNLILVASAVVLVGCGDGSPAQATATPALPAPTAAAQLAPTMVAQPTAAPEPTSNSFGSAEEIGEVTVTKGAPGTITCATGVINSLTDGEAGIIAVVNNANGLPTAAFYANSEAPRGFVIKYVTIEGEEVDRVALVFAEQLYDPIVGTGTLVYTTLTGDEDPKLASGIGLGYRKVDNVHEYTCVEEASPDKLDEFPSGVQESNQY